MDAELIHPMREHMDRLRGRLFELVEVTGMPPEQQEAFKRLIRRLSYDAQRDLEKRLRELDRTA